MNIRLRFKLIALLIVLSLAGLLVFQGYWLKGLYDTLYKQMEINIEEAMKIADYKELFLRIRSIKKEQGALGPQTQDVYFSSELDPSNKQKMDAKASIHPQKEDPDLNREDIFKTANPDSHMKLHIDYGDEEDFSSIDSTLTDYLYVIGEVEDMVQQAMHANIDSIKPIDFKTYNKLLTSELEARNIVTEHELVTIYKPNNGDEKGWMHLDKPERFTTWKNPVHFDYPLHNESTLQYRLFLKSPASVILTQMKGILISSFLLLLLIICAFIYLLRTILKQKTVEELKTDFTNNMTHELKTPIALIQGYAEGLKDNINDDEESREFYCDVIIDEAAKMNEMVKKLLNLNQLEFGEDQVNMERFDLNAVIKGVLQSSDILIRQKEAKVLFTGGDPLYVWGDEFKVEEVITNYLTNALNHLDYDHTIEITCKKEGNVVKTTVFNTGDPIPEEDLDKVWVKFFKVDKARTREYGGSGIGLSIVKAIMDSFQQQCGCQNYDNGVAFWFTLEADGKTEEV